MSQTAAVPFQDHPDFGEIGGTFRWLTDSLKEPETMALTMALTQLHRLPEGA
jgi:hypothetical protein